MSLVFPSYFGKIPMSIAGILFENSYRIIFILNLNNSASNVKDLEVLKGNAEQEVDGVKVGLDVRALRHQLERIQEQPKLHDDTVILVGSLLTTIIFMMILLFFRKRIMLKIQEQISRWKRPTLAARSRPGIVSGELLVGNNGATSESSPSVLYHHGIE